MTEKQRNIIGLVLLVLLVAGLIAYGRLEAATQTPQRECTWQKIDGGGEICRQ